MFWCVPHYLDAFETVWLPYGTRCKSCSRVRIFCNKRTRSTPLDPKLMFCCVLYYLGAFGTIWLPYGTRCKTGVCKRLCHEVASEFFAMNAPDPPYRTLN